MQTQEVILWSVSGVLLAAALISFATDRRRLRNGVFFLLSVGVALLALGYNDNTFWVFGLTMVAAFLALPVLSLFLITNGIILIRREGFRIANLLSIVAGLAIPATPVIMAVLAALTNRADYNPWQGILPLWFFLVVVYVAFIFMAFLIYSLIYSATGSRKTPDYVVILGAGLINGRVTPLLAARLDAAVKIYRRAPQGKEPVLIPSGGQGPDESRSEGEAMAEYLLEQGIPAAHVVPETKSRTTMENLELSRALMSGEDPVITITTSNYHAFRAAMYSRRVGLRAVVRGARTAFYYVPSAFLREFIAVVVQYKWINIGICLLLGVGVTALVLVTAPQL